MTHEELVKELDFAAKACEGFTAYILALRVVVELHKPRTETAPCDCCKEITVCDACDKGVQVNKWIDYPCPTIQAIEKELK